VVVVVVSRPLRRRVTATLIARPRSHAGDAGSFAGADAAETAQLTPPLPRTSAPGVVQNPSAHAPLRHCAFSVQLPFEGTPQAPSEKHTLLVHWLACAHVLEFTSPHDFASALHLPEAHVACAFASVQPPSWRPSFGIGVPDGSFGRHVFALRAQ
jgi:hypothetical protein